MFINSFIGTRQKLETKMFHNWDLKKKTVVHIYKMNYNSPIKPIDTYNI